MSDDIVTRLREIERAVRPGMQPLYLHVLCGDAADEIELLRSTVTDCRIEIERLTAERDEIRLSYCSLMEAYRGGDGRVTANKLGWGYLFAKDSK
jgi:hypothetical protein